MDLIRLAIDRPVAMVAAVLMVILFGLVALTRIPIQLAPDVNQPVISVNTIWPGAAPAEVEREILNRQEEQLAGLTGLVSITGSASRGRGQITLEFKIGTNMDRALLLVANRLDRVPNYPEEADRPSMDTAGNDDNAIAWFVLTGQPGVEQPVNEFGDFAEDVIKTRLERVPGVGRVNVFGGRERELQVEVLPAQLAAYQLSVDDLLTALRNANVSLSAGDIDEGKRRYVVRTEAELTTPEEVRAVLVRGPSAFQSGRVTIGDVANVQFGYKRAGASIRMFGRPALAMNVERRTGSNVIETMRGLKAAVDELNQSAIPRAGLSLRQVYDETVYINSAVDLVQQNIWVGGALAVLILLLFLRSLRATVVVALSIPVSIIGAFVAMAFLGRSINVISLAGLAFAVGMVVDAAIVVLENIYRLKESGHSNWKAAYHGAKQVWSAVLVSVLTTVLVFVPILVMELEAGQLFRDIAVAVSVAVVLSLLVSISVIPALARALLKEVDDDRRVRINWADRAGEALVRGVLALTRRVIDNRKLAGIMVLGISTLALGGAYLLLPKLEYLPEGNRNLLFGLVIPPAGYNLDTTTQIAEGIEAATRPLWVGDEFAAADSDSADSADSADSVSDSADTADPAAAAPRIERFFFVALEARTFIGIVAEDPKRVAELKPIISREIFSEPGTFGFVSQPSIFGRGLGGGRRIELDIAGPEMADLFATAGRAFQKVLQHFPREAGNEWRPVPGLEFGAPEVRVFPDRLRLRDSGLSATQLGRTLDAFNDGLRATQTTIGGKSLDITLKGPDDGVSATQEVDQLPLVTPQGLIVPLGSVARTELTTGPTEIRHRERFRTITLEIRPSPDLPLEVAIDTVNREIIAPLREEGLPPGVQLNLAGTADKLIVTRDAMALNLMLSLVIIFLVMAILFESFVYPLIIMLSVPVAMAGGFLGLAMLNWFTYQPLDMLTMLGFIILVGIVVNNAILLVHQTLQNARDEHMPVDDAIITATKNRIRPIFMSTLTSVFGMLPLVLFPGAGSELYRGLGSVIVGGLALSALLTLLVVPPMLALLVAPIEERRRARQTRTATPDPT